MYNPSPDNDDLEFVEILNVTDASINMANWKFTNGIDFTFGATTLPARGNLLVLRFDPNNPGNATKLAAFQAAYPNIPQGTILVGGYAGTIEGGVLNNGGETLRISRPDEPPANEPTFIPYILVDEVEYDDVAPWPTSPDGTGASLTRVNTTVVFGNEPTNWTGSAPTPGGLPLPGPTTDLVATATAANRIHLTWTDGSNNEAGFRIERFDGVGFVQVATTLPNVTSFDHVNLQSSINHTYRVRAFNTAGDGPSSQNASATTPQLATITGSNLDEDYHVTVEGTLLKIYENELPGGQPTYSSELAAMTGTLTINAGDGNDILTVDSGAQPSLGLKRLVYNAGAGSNNLVLQKGDERIDSTAAGGTLNTTVQAGSELTTDQLNQNGLTLADTARATLLAGGATSKLTSLNLAPGATLDITNNALVVDYTGASPVSDVRASILSARGGSGLGKLWNGTGITSSTAAQINATAPDSRSVGYAENALLPLGAYGDFRGQAVDATSVLIAYTRTADANLDGFVNNNDVTVVGANFAPVLPKHSWALGDFEFNGSVDNDDVTLLGVFYNPSAPLPPPATLEASGDAVSGESSGDTGSLSTGVTTASVDVSPEPGPQVAAIVAFDATSSAGGANGQVRQELASVAWQDAGGASKDDAIVDLLALSIAAEGDSNAGARLASRSTSASDDLWAGALWSDAA
jgi:hypothetical protein